MKKVIWFILVIIIVIAGWYLASPLFINNEVNEALPAIEELAVMGEEERMRYKDRMLAEFVAMPDTVKAEDMPAVLALEDSKPQFVELLRGEFKGADAFHTASGSATIYALNAANRFLRLEDFSVTNGPDLRVLLVGHPDPQNREGVEHDGYIELEKLKGNIGDQNYIIPADIDLTKYRSVVIYCKPFHVLFGVAPLNESS